MRGSSHYDFWRSLAAKTNSDVDEKLDAVEDVTSKKNDYDRLRADDIGGDDPVNN